MAYVFGYNLSHQSESILGKLLIFRGMTAKQLTAMMYAPHPYSLSEEKSVYNYLRKLKKQGLVAAYKLQANVANGSIYYLTQKGYEYAKDMMNIPEGAIGSGWTSLYQDYTEVDFGDLPYDLYVPPIKQPAHHLMLIEFFIRVNMIDQDGFDPIQHRLNLYASKTYEMDNQKYRYRPDGEIDISGKRFAIEIDRATESHEQLLQKFETYERYLDYCSTNRDNDFDKIKGIIFVVESKRRDHGIKRRWTNILAAFFKKLYKYRNELNLIMVTLDTAEEALVFELKRYLYEKKAMQEISGILKEKGFFKSTSWKNTYTGEALFTHGFNDTEYGLFFNTISQEFESRFYARYLDFIENRLSFAKNQDNVENIRGLRYNGHEAVIFFDRFKPNLVKNLEYYSVEHNLIVVFNLLHDVVTFHELNPMTTFSLFDN